MMDRSNAAFVLTACFIFSQLICHVAAITRTYYIAAVEKEWDYAPSGYNNIKGVKLEDDRQAELIKFYIVLKTDRFWRCSPYMRFTVVFWLKGALGCKTPPS